MPTEDRWASWKSIWRAQMGEGLGLRRRICALEADLDLYRKALAQTERDLVIVRSEYALSADLAHQMFETFKSDLMQAEVSPPDNPTEETTNA